MFSGARDAIYQEDNTDAREWLENYLNPELGKCILITGGTSYDNNFEYKWNYYIK